MIRSARRRAGWHRLIGAAALFALSQVTAPGAVADEPSETGWWWKVQPSTTFPVPFTPDPVVPPGGLFVAGDATGPSAVSALRFDPLIDPVDLVLTLEVDRALGAPVVKACPVLVPWEPVEGGAWEQQPLADCDFGASDGVVSDDGTTITFSIAAPPPGDAVDIVLSPGIDPTTAGGATFSVSFKPPSYDALTYDTASEDVDDDDDFGGSGEQPPPPSFDAGADDATPFVSGFGDEYTAPADAPAAGAPAPSVVQAPPSRPVSTDLPLSDDFAYPGVLALPLLVLVLGTYVARTLTRPVPAPARTPR